MKKAADKLFIEIRKNKMNRIVVLVGSMRKGGNTDLLAQALEG